MKVLFLAFEGEARLMADLAARVKKRGGSVFVASCDHFTVTHSRGEVYDYYRAAGLSENEFTNIESVLIELNRCSPNVSSEDIDWAFLKDFENKHCRVFSLMEMVAMDPIMSGSYHNRDIYYRTKNKMLLYKFLELSIKWIDRLFSSDEPDVIVAVNFQYFFKAAIYCLAHAKGIKHYTIMTSRIGNTYLVVDNFSLGASAEIVAEMKRLQESNEPCREAVAYMQRILRDQSPAYKDFEITMQHIRDRMKRIARLRNLFNLLTRYLKSSLLVHRRYRGFLKGNYFLPSYWLVLRMEVISAWRQLRYFQHRELREGLPNEPFVFFPLHLIPENSVLTLSRTFDELECIFQLSKALPIGWKVIVKMNPNMLAGLDSHPNSYYLAISKIPNVHIVDPLIPGPQIVHKAAAVAGISGTALLEAAIADKPSFRWGRVEFDPVDSVIRFDPRTVKDHLKAGKSKNVRYYIQACINAGIELNYRLLVRPVHEPLSAEEIKERDQQLGQLEAKLFQAPAEATPAAAIKKVRSMP